MRKRSLILLAAATIGLAASQASAADLPRKAPAYLPPPPPPVTWTGCYIGGNIGGAFGDASLSGAGGTVSGDGSGFAGGGQIGCDYQFSGGWVVGIRNMFDGTSNKNSGTIGSGPLAGDVVNFNNQWFDTLTARLGYAFQPAWLLYLQGGGAWGHTSTNITAGGVQIARPPTPEQAGRLVAALNGCSRRTGPHSSKATTWTSDRATGPHSLQSERLVRRVRFQRQSNRDDCPDWCELPILLSDFERLRSTAQLRKFKTPGNLPGVFCRRVQRWRTARAIGLASHRRAAFQKEIGGAA